MNTRTRNQAVLRLRICNRLHPHRPSDLLRFTEIPITVLDQTTLQYLLIVRIDMFQPTPVHYFTNHVHLIIASLDKYFRIKFKCRWYGRTLTHLN